MTWAGDVQIELRILCFIFLAFCTYDVVSDVSMQSSFLCEWCMEQSTPFISAWVHLLSAAFFGGYLGSRSGPDLPTVAVPSHDFQEQDFEPAAAGLSRLALYATAFAGFILGWAARGWLRDCWARLEGFGSFGASVGDPPAAPARPRSGPTPRASPPSSTTGQSFPSLPSTPTESLALEDDSGVWRPRRR